MEKVNNQWKDTITKNESGHPASNEHSGEENTQLKSAIKAAQ
jgi:hypothetical protein